MCTVIVFFCPRRPGRGWLVSGPGSASRGRNFSSCTGSILLASYVWRNPTEMTHTNKPFIEQSEIIRFREIYCDFVYLAELRFSEKTIQLDLAKILCIHTSFKTRRVASSSAIFLFNVNSTVTNRFKKKKTKNTAILCIVYLSWITRRISDENDSNI